MEKRKYRRDEFLVYAGWLIDGTGSHYKKNRVIHIKNRRIISISSYLHKDLVLPENKTLDFSNSTILPGLIDSHVHLFMSGTNDKKIRSWQLDASFKDMIPVIETHLRQHFSSGIVGVRDGGDYGGFSLLYKQEYQDYENSPVIIACSGKALHAPNRYGRLIGRALFPDSSLKEVILKEKDIPTDYIKIVNSGLNSLKEFGKETLPQFSLHELLEAVHTARSIGKSVMVHANGKLPVKMAIQAGATSVEHGFFMGKDNLKLLADSPTIWVPTAFTMLAYHNEHSRGSKEAHIAVRNLQHQIEQIKIARDLGVSMAIGTDSGSIGVHHGISIIEEIKLFLKAGLSIEETIMCATYNGARLLGKEKELGRLLPGMAATFIAVSGSPSELPESLSSPSLIVIDGEIYSLRNN